MSFYIYLLAILSLLLPITNSNFTSEECTTYPPTNQGCKCHLKGDRIFCCHTNATQESCLPRARFSTTHSGEVVTSLAIQSLSLSHLALTYGFISKLGIDPKTLKRLQITQGPREPNQIALESVNICSNHQDSNSILKCQDLVGLKVLDLRHNSLTTLEEFQLPSLQELYLSGNPWSCLPKKHETQHPLANKSSEDLSIGDKPVIIHKPLHSLQWLLNLPNNTSIMEENETTCALGSETWVRKESNYSNAQLLDFLRENKMIQETCPLECKCSVDQNKLRHNVSIPVYVECRNRNLSQLPDRLPPKTRRLDVSLNQISSLEPIRTNKDYENLEYFIACDNALTSIRDLIGSNFSHRGPGELYLLGNRIHEFDLEVLNEAMAVGRFQSFYLSENPWSCHCNNIKEIQNFIYEHQEVIKDHANVTCDDGTKIIEIDYNGLCMTSSEGGTDSMTILICIEVILLILVVSKLFYDYRQYNRTGALPWLARSGCLSYNMPVKSELRNPGNPLHGNFKSMLFQRCFSGSADQVPSEDSSRGHLDVFRPKRYFLSPRHISELDSIDEVSSTNEDTTALNGTNRTKKISIEEAEALDKNVLDPEKAGNDDCYPMKEFTLIVHQPPENDDEQTPLRKISRLQKSNSAGLDLNRGEALL